MFTYEAGQATVNFTDNEIFIIVLFVVLILYCITVLQKYMKLLKRMYCISYCRILYQLHTIIKQTSWSQSETPSSSSKGFRFDHKL